MMDKLKTNIKPGNKASGIELEVIETQKDIFDPGHDSIYARRIFKNGNRAKVKKFTSKEIEEVTMKTSLSIEFLTVTPHNQSITEGGGSSNDCEIMFQGIEKTRAGLFAIIEIRMFDCDFKYLPTRKTRSSATVYQDGKPLFAFYLHNGLTEKIGDVCLINGIYVGARVKVMFTEIDCVQDFSLTNNEIVL